MHASSLILPCVAPRSSLQLTLSLCLLRIFHAMLGSCLVDRLLCFQLLDWICTQKSTIQQKSTEIKFSYTILGGGDKNLTAFVEHRDQIEPRAAEVALYLNSESLPDEDADSKLLPFT